MPGYDKWYRDVLKGKRKSFYPNRIRLLEKPGVPLFLFHVHYHAIVGEATIVRSTVEGGKHFYWFDEFLSYPYPIEPELLKTDSRLPKARRGRWKIMYISSEVIEEIRFLSTLSKETRKELGIEIVEQLRKRTERKPSWEYYMVSECNKLREKYAFGETVLNEAQNYFAECKEKKLIASVSHDVIFYAALYLAFRMLEIPKLCCDIANISGISSRKLRKFYLLLAKRLNRTIPVLNPENLIESRSVKLGVTKQTIDTAVSLARIARKNVITMGKAPSAIAAAAIVVACDRRNEKIERTAVAKLFDVSTVTIRNRYKELEAIICT